MSTPPGESGESRLRVPWAAFALATICLLWAGMVLGISCLEAPIKFSAPTLTREVGIDVGRTVFSAFNKVEIVWSALTFGLFLFARPFHRAPRLIGVLLALVWLIVWFQTLYLLPALVERALLVMNGRTPPASPIHALYSSSELIKLVSLIMLGVCLMRSFCGGGKIVGTANEKAKE